MNIKSQLDNGEPVNSYQTKMTFRYLRQINEDFQTENNIMSSDRILLARVTDQDMDSLKVKDTKQEEIVEKQDKIDVINNLMGSFFR